MGEAQYTSESQLSLPEVAYTDGRPHHGPGPSTRTCDAFPEGDDVSSSTMLDAVRPLVSMLSLDGSLR